ncbi:uncharacterized protein [Nicotiana sylvestris]|uniref:uncharacterized protein n=1 Tax=Nicotiana sylvestris TaxID=4096 RepID=UPI00388C8049
MQLPIISEKAVPWSYSQINIHWERPPLNKIKLNIDGAFLKDKLHADIGGVYRNSTGNWIMGFTRSCYSYSSMQAELLALEEGLKIAVEMPFVEIEIEADSTDILKMLSEENVSTNARLLNCGSLMRQLKSPLMRHNFREGNAVADCLAKEAVKNFKPGKCYHHAWPPLFVEAILEKDMQGLCLGIKKLSTNVRKCITIQCKAAYHERMFHLVGARMTKNRQID